MWVLCLLFTKMSKIKKGFPGFDMDVSSGSFVIHKHPPIIDDIIGDAPNGNSQDVKSALYS